MDDNRVCMDHRVIKKGDRIPLPLDPNGRFTAEVPEWKGELCFDANKAIMKNIKDRGRMIKQLQKFHSYPYCWRFFFKIFYSLFFFFFSHSFLILFSFFSHSFLIILSLFSKHSLTILSSFSPFPHPPGLIPL